jgi:hypothetical protein
MPISEKEEKLHELMSDCLHSIDTQMISYESKMKKKEELIKDFKSSWKTCVEPQILKAANRGDYCVDIVCNSEHKNGFLEIAKLLGYRITDCWGNYISLSWKPI